MDTALPVPRSGLSSVGCFLWVVAGVLTIISIVGLFGCDGAANYERQRERDREFNRQREIKKLERLKLEAELHRK